MKRSHASLLLLAGVFATSAFAQQGMVKVDLGTVADALAKNINVEVDKIPTSVQLPVGVAAGACGVPAAKLAPAGSDMAACQATSTSSALEELVAKQVKTAPKQ
ncbi:hypothetical protein [Ramlibacter alkalitolerans]|jgi:hypothetical protein|uniref:Uncharacterized protein n=1 Tax=Ramlibacter alkalitolerans TaxID=2039631 RepID=A0ABS1JJW6_9BURK|nr:hypothetical protein [Ramlibacter alkalitolerans]MBL0424110.1 hypothetical protein [Ramlibacter alkalitolerans]